MKTMTQPTTDLPTEPGLYLFIGVRSLSDITRIDRSPPRTELVSIRHDSTGKLQYIGSDFFWKPHEAIGAWVPVDVSELQEAANVVLHDRLMRQYVEKFKAQRWERNHTRDRFVDYLTEPGWARQPEVEDAVLASWLGELAVRAGLIAEN
jgi:hypothetical protein